MYRGTKNLLMVAGVAFVGYYLFGRWWKRRMNMERIKQLQYVQQTGQQTNVQG